MKHLLFAISLTLLGCASPRSQNIALVHAGMTKQEVNKLVGQPINITRQGALEIMDFAVKQQGPTPLNPNETPHSSYYVIFGPDGKVESIGRN